MSEPRTPKGTTEERVQRFTATLDQAIHKIENRDPVKGIGKVSPVEAALQPLRDRIRTQLDRGYKAGTIARIIKEADGLDDTYAQETIRLAILRLTSKEPPSKPKPPAKTRKQSDSDGGKQQNERGSGHSSNEQSEKRPTIVAPPSTTSHAGFEEDAR